jgi:hypothetical protein
MKTFLIFDLASTSSAEPRFLIGERPGRWWPAAAGAFGRAECRRDQCVGSAGASPYLKLMCQCKYMIARGLGRKQAFFGPFLTLNNLISRRLGEFRGKISQQAEHGPEMLETRYLVTYHFNWSRGRVQTIRTDYDAYRRLRFFCSLASRACTQYEEGGTADGNVWAHQRFALPIEVPGTRSHARD